MKKVYIVSFLFIAIAIGISYFTYDSEDPKHNPFGWTEIHDYSFMEKIAIDKEIRAINLTVDMDIVNQSIQEPHKVNKISKYATIPTGVITIDRKLITTSELAYHAIGQNGTKLILIKWTGGGHGFPILITISADGVVTNAEPFTHQAESSIEANISQGKYNGDPLLFNGDSFDRWVRQYTMKRR